MFILFLFSLLQFVFFVVLMVTVIINILFLIDTSNRLRNSGTNSNNGGLYLIYFSKCLHNINHLSHFLDDLSYSDSSANQVIDFDPNRSNSLRPRSLRLQQENQTPALRTNRPRVLKLEILSSQSRVYVNVDGTMVWISCAFSYFLVNIHSFFSFCYLLDIR